MNMQCSFPRPVKNGNVTLYVPCGQCICCRINKTTEWSLRLIFESMDYADNQCMFVTLTYNDEYMPKDLSLHKEDLQKFMKRLRKSLSKDNRKIRFFACGEYGEKNIISTGFGRPHYHLIIFGMSPDNDDDRNLIKWSWRFCDEFLFDKKHKGIGTVNNDSIQYTCGYIRKKLLGQSKVEYEKRGLVPPFQLQSQGLGLNGFQRYMKEYNNPLFVTFHGKKLPIPRFFREKFNIDTTSIVSEVKSKEYDYLLNQGFENRELTRLKMNSSNGSDFVENLYYDKIRPSLEQNHENKIKQLSMRQRKGI